MTMQKALIEGVICSFWVNRCEPGVVPPHEGGVLRYSLPLLRLLLGYTRRYTAERLLETAHFKVDVG